MLEWHFNATHTETEEFMVLASDEQDNFFIIPWNKVIGEDRVTLYIPHDLGKYKNLEPLQNNKVYRHYKNVLYTTYFDASHIVTGEKFVIYTSDKYLKRGIFWARPYDMFHGNQVLEDGTKVKRFTLIE